MLHSLDEAVVWELNVYRDKVARPHFPAAKSGAVGFDVLGNGVDGGGDAVSLDVACADETDVLGSNPIITARRAPPTVG